MRGDLMVAQSGGPTAVINASLAGIVSAARKSGGFKRVLGLRHGILGALPGGKGIVDLSELQKDRLLALAQTPGAALGSCRRKLDEEETASLVEWFKANEIHAFSCIGGNDSMQTCLQLEQAAQEAGYELSVVGVPKTIDNDLLETDHSPGYGSAARFWASTVQEVALDLEAMRGYDTVVVLECMGRNAGWIVAASALGRRAVNGPPHLLLTPEVPIVLDQFLDEVHRVVSQHGSAVIVTAETVRGKDGGFLASVAPESPGVMADSFGHPNAFGTAEYIARTISLALGVKARVTKPGTLQRASSTLTSAVDRNEAWQVGTEAVRLLARGESGVMVTIQAERSPHYRSWCDSVALERVAGQERALPSSYLDVQDGGACNVTPAYEHYARPLLGGDLPQFVNPL